MLTLKDFISRELTKHKKIALPKSKDKFTQLFILTMGKNALYKMHTTNKNYIVSYKDTLITL